MNYQRVLTIQDLSCLGQCSLAVALPILSACELETVILPTAILSTHTAKGFEGYTCHDLTTEMPKIAMHWQEKNLFFDAIYTGYLGSITQISYVKDIIHNLKKQHAKIFIDPAMADNGKLYAAFNLDFVQEMKSLIKHADIILPNITEACLLTNTPYLDAYTEHDILDLIAKLQALSAKNIILTGVSYKAETTGVVIVYNQDFSYYEHKKISKGCHGTGDVFASAFVGAFLNGHSAFDAAKIAADFTVKSIENTIEDKTHWYGVKFEIALPELIEQVKN